MIASNPTRNEVERLKTPPHSIEAEQSVLGSMMIAPDCWDRVAEIVTAEDFYNCSHQVIFSATIELLEQSKPIDLVTVNDHLEYTQKIDDAGGFSYLAELAKNTPSAANVVAYAKIVREKGLLRRLIAVANDVAESSYFPNGRQAKEVIYLADTELNRIAEGLGSAKDTSIRTAMKKAIDRMEAANKTGITGIPTHLPDLDRLTCGFQQGDLVIIAARPSMGKTALALNFTIEAAKQQKHTLFFSLEMPSDQLMQRYASYEAKVEADRMRNPLGQKQENGGYAGGMDDEHYAKLSAAVAKIDQLEKYLEIDDTSDQSILDLRIEARKFAKKHGRIDMIVVDYLQIMKPPKAENRTQEITQISKGLKSLAKEFHCPVIALSQLSRGLESRANKRPLNSDLRESGSIEQDADLILFVYRDEYYNQDSPDKGLAEIIIGKQRNGPLGKVGAVFLGQYSAFLPMVNRSLLAEKHQHKPYERGLDI